MPGAPSGQSNAKIAALAGINQFQMFVTVNTKKFPRGILDQVISKSTCDGESERAPDPGLKQQASSIKLQASSFKRQAFKRQALQASSDKRQAPGCKRQASSHKRQAP
jgi:hypothetical protein